VLIIGYWVYIFEREQQDMSFGVSIYLVFLCMVTGWASDVYDEYDPRSPLGKIGCILAAIFGLFWFALLIDYIHQKMRATRFEEIALDWVTQSSAMQEQRNESARLIQMLWRHYAWKKSMESLVIVQKRQPAPDIEDWEQSKKFDVKFRKQLERTKNIRNEKTAADMEVKDRGFEGVDEGHVLQHIQRSVEHMKNSLKEDFAHMLDRKFRQQFGDHPQSGAVDVAQADEGSPFEIQTI